MSTYSFPEELNTDEMMKQMRAMNGWMNAEGCEVPPVLMPPAEVTAAATMVGFGIAGYLTGLFIGSMQGAMNMTAMALAGPATGGAGWGLPEKMAGNVSGVPPVAASAEAARTVVGPAGGEGGLATAKIVPLPRAKVRKTRKRAAAEVVRAPRAKASSVKTVAPITLEPEDFRRPAEMGKPERPDDLRRVPGVGPKLEQVLNRLGIWTFSQIASWGDEEIAWVDDYLQLGGRIVRDDWIGQAKALTRKSADKASRVAGVAPK